MPLAVTLRLDDAIAGAVVRLWHVLAAQTGDDDALRAGYAPHLTLAVIPHDRAAAAIEAAVFALAGHWEALPLMLAGFGVFPGASPVIWLAPVATEALLARHKTLHAALAPEPVDRHYAPGAWAPHITLTRRARSAARALEVALSVWSGPMEGWADRIELVRFHPVDILRSQPLRFTGGNRQS